MTKLRVALLFGGTSTEHEVSVVSASGIYQALDKKKYQVTPIRLAKDNTWEAVKTIKPSYTKVKAGKLKSATDSISSITKVFDSLTFDVVFPVLHGPYGEDGTIQGLLELLRLPYVGCGVTGSAVCMDKVLQKNICRDYGIPVVRFFWLSREHWADKQAQTLGLIRSQLGDSYPLFIKPANQGSSVGVTKAHNEQELLVGIQEALTRDTKIIIEVGVEHAREIECSVLGTNASPETSSLGEIIPGNEFYDYRAKYLEDNSTSEIPAQLDEELATKIKHTARLAFEILDCYGLARVDFLVNRQTGEFFLNELNTMPGFTPISMYPKLWEHAGLSYPKLLDRLIALALARHQIRESLSFSL